MGGTMLARHAKTKLSAGVRAGLRPHGGIMLTRSLAVQAVSEKQQYTDAVAGANLTVVYFTAAWCPPCRMISPVYESLSEEHPEASFLKVDVDEQRELSAAAQISAMPTFQFMRDGVKVKEIVGADTSALKDAVES